MNIPERWQEVLRKLKEAGYAEAFIGGGAMRDLAHGKDVKDVDIFIRDKGYLTFENVERALGYCGEDVTVFGKYDGVEIVGVFEFAHAPVAIQGEQPDFNIISCSGPADPREFMEHHLSRFDLGICRIGYDGKMIVSMPEYWRDKVCKTITLVNPWNHARSIERAERIRDRSYRDWKIVDPNTFDFDAT